MYTSVYTSESARLCRNRNGDNWVRGIAFAFPVHASWISVRTVSYQIPNRRLGRLDFVWVPGTAMDEAWLFTQSTKCGTKSRGKREKEREACWKRTKGFERVCVCVCVQVYACLFWREDVHESCELLDKFEFKWIFRTRYTISITRVVNELQNSFEVNTCLSCVYIYIYIGEGKCYCDALRDTVFRTIWFVESQGSRYSILLMTSFS